MKLYKYRDYYSNLEKWKEVWGDIDDIMRNTEMAYFRGNVCPLRKDLFRVFELLPPEGVRVVILGQDPGHSLIRSKTQSMEGLTQHGEGLPKADGIAFSSNDQREWYPSMESVLTEIRACGQGSIFKTKKLDQWVKQGVLLTNVSFISRAGLAWAYPDAGWLTVVYRMLRYLSRKQSQPIVFMLWGTSARTAREAIYSESSLPDPTVKKSRFHNLVLETSHPSPVSKNKGFLGCRHFALCNEFLMEHYSDPVYWDLYPDAIAEEYYGK